MNLSSKTRKNINNFLFLASFLIVIAAVWWTFVIVRQISNDEHHKVRMWVSSVQRKANLIEYSKNFFEQIEQSERNRLELWAGALLKMAHARSAVEFELYRQISEENTTIPVIVTSQDFKILHHTNTRFDYLGTEAPEYLEGELLEDFSQYPPLVVSFMGGYWYFFYQHPKAFIELQQILDDVIHSFMDEIVTNSIFAPILVVTKDERTVIQAGNISPEEYADPATLRKTLNRMRAQNKPIEFSFDTYETLLIFYESSIIARRLVYLPIIAFAILFIFALYLIWVVKMSRQSESNKLWVGMSRETAHQLGTPLSSLMGWTEYLRSQNVDEKYLVEIKKDIDRLVVISERFSKIGSEPKMKTENIVQIIHKSITYLQPRLSQKIKIQVNVSPNAVILTSVNAQLLEWVLENLAANAVDAIGTKDGLVEIYITEQIKTITIDIVDSGKGIPKTQWKTVFEAGYTTKSRGWGLGLTLCHRIIHNYHKGDIFVKQSAAGEGTTFRIILKK